MTSVCFEFLFETLTLPAGGSVSGTLAYVGPGAGLTMLGALIAVGCVLLVALAAPLLYPIHVVRRWLRNRQRSPDTAEDAVCVTATVDLPADEACGSFPRRAEATESAASHSW